MRGSRRLVVLADAFNFLNQQTVTAYDDYTEVTFGVVNPDFGSRIAYQTPRTFRFGARWEF